MSGSGAEKRNRALAIQCANLKENWRLTHKQIAVIVGKKADQIKGLILLGQRLKALPKEKQ